MKLFYPRESPLHKSLKPIQTPTGKLFTPFSGQVLYCDSSYPMIQLIDVPLCTPSGDVLVNSINFKVVIGQNVLITGKFNS